LRFLDRSGWHSLRDRWSHFSLVDPRSFLLAFVAASSVALCGQDAQRSPVQVDKDSCRSFVQEFYDWYTPIAASAGTRVSVSLLPRQMSFDQKLWKMLVVDDEAQSKSSYIVGLDFDPILNSQDPSSKFMVKGVSIQGIHCSAEVVGIEQGVHEERVKPELVLASGRWIFVNFHYQDEVAGKLWKSNLLQILRYWQKQRSRLPKENSE
jgi:hypothetical protein